ncbi:flagellar hook-basal body complex protein FliE, partial [Oceanobacillus massiliensis]|uniref:flagellar hook-basal body complex protein FliE n=1 Tax=Oceanobacillus massiliensis TaxID=1465765 RepID=UPI0005C850E8
MTISINDVSQAYNATQLNATKPSVTSGDAQANFADSLKGAIENLNTIQMESDAKTTALANGNIDDLHDVMITAQKASVTLETTVQVQKKVIDAYNEIMRMQV